MDRAILLYPFYFVFLLFSGIYYNSEWAMTVLDVGVPLPSRRLGVSSDNTH